VALKEWAVAVRVLDAGQSILLVRKGGIREPGKAFRVREERFLLYPTYEHQRAELLKPQFQGDLQATLDAAPPPTAVTFGHWAQVHQVLEVTDPARLETLSPHHIWSADYARKRLHWKPRQPLAAMLVRVYRLAQPQTIPVLPAYIGCTSWVDLDREVALGAMEPVLPDEVFHREADAIRSALGLLAARV
jgi:hypothetical protein